EAQRGIGVKRWPCLFDLFRQTDRPAGALDRIHVRSCSATGADAGKRRLSSGLWAIAVARTCQFIATDGRSQSHFEVGRFPLPPGDLATGVVLNEPQRRGIG